MIPDSSMISRTEDLELEDGLLVFTGEPLGDLDDAVNEALESRLDSLCEGFLTTPTRASRVKKRRSKPRSA